MDDIVSGPIWPQVSPLLSEQPVLLEDLATLKGVSTATILKVLQDMEAVGQARLVLAPACPKCESSDMGYFEDPEDMPESLTCKECSQTFAAEDVDAKLVYLLEVRDEH